MKVFISHKNVDSQQALMLKSAFERGCFHIFRRSG